MGADLNYFKEWSDLSSMADLGIDLSSLNICDEAIDWSFLNDTFNFDVDWLKNEEFNFDSDWLKEWQIDWDDFKLDSEFDSDWLKTVELADLNIDDVDFWKDVDSKL